MALTDSTPRIEGKRGWAPNTVVLTAEFPADRILFCVGHRDEITKDAKILLKSAKAFKEDNSISEALVNFINMMVHHSGNKGWQNENEFVVHFPGLKPIAAHCEYLKG